MSQQAFLKFRTPCLLAASTIVLSCTRQSETGDIPNKEAVTAGPKALPVKSPDLSRFKSNIVTEMDSHVLNIFQDKNGCYWFGTNDGLYYYDGESLARFTTADGLSQNQVLDIQEDASGTIWLATGGFGVNYFDGKRFKTLEVDEPDSGKPKEKKWSKKPGDLWFAAGSGVFCNSAGSFSYLSFPTTGSTSGLQGKSPSQGSIYGVYSILEDRDGNL